MTVRLGTRGSQLALYQANTVAALLRRSAGVECEIAIIKTSGDRLSEATLSDIGGKRLFVKEIEDALLGGEVDLAVHSSKDMPAVLLPGLAIGAVLPRADARDALVLPAGQAGATPPDGLSLDAVVTQLGDAPRIGTSSVRRSAQLARVFPGARFVPIRGNLDTRLRKVDAGDYDVLVLASAGLIRLEHRARISAALPIDACIPAPGQGIIAIEIRDGDDAIGRHVAAIDDATTRAAFDAERTVVTRLGGGCQMPIGAYARVTDATLDMTAVVLSLDGRQALRARALGSLGTPHAVGAEVAERLLAQGAGAILAAIEGARAEAGQSHP